MKKADYNESTFVSDYTFLEDTSRAVDAAVRTRQDLIPIPGRPNRALKPGVSKGRMNMLVREAAKRNINLHFMPRGFARHSRNSSFVRTIPEDSETERRTDDREKAMFWHLDVYFASCNEKRPGTRLVKVDTCEEEQCINVIMKGAVDALRKGKKRTRSGTITCGRKENDGYAKYLEALEEDLVAFLRNEHVLTPNEHLEATSGPAGPFMRLEEFGVQRYVQLGKSQTLRESLTGRSVVEYPVLHIAFKNSCQEHELRDATCGLFEKPDESDGSESGSESESESEDDQEKEESSKKPDSPVHGASRMEAGQSNAAVGRGDELAAALKDEHEPPMKIRKPELSASEYPLNVKENGAERGRRDSGHRNECVGDGNLKANTGSTVDCSDKEPSTESRGVTPSTGKGFRSEAEGLLKKASNSPGIGSPATNSFDTDIAERKDAQLALDHPFMKESVKAILGTRIPRKRRASGETYNSNTKKPKSTQISTSGW